MGVVADVLSGCRPVPLDLGGVTDGPFAEFVGTVDEVNPERNKVKVLRPQLAEAQARRLGVDRPDLALALQQSNDGAPAGVYRELAEDYYIHMAARSAVRANIYDAKGKGLAAEGSKVIVGVVPGEIEDEAALLSRLSLVLDLPRDEIQATYEDQPATWFIPIGDLSLEASREHYDLLSSEPGISLRERAVRTYRDPPGVPHVVGSMGRIPAEELAASGQPTLVEALDEELARRPAAGDEPGRAGDADRRRLLQRAPRGGAG